MISALLVACLLGAVQALTEFLPVSSSAHLLVTPWLLGIENPGLAFDAALHIGTALALVWYFRKDFITIVRERGKLLTYIIIASIPGGAIGFLGGRVIEQIFHEGSQAILSVVIGMLIATAVIWQIDKRARNTRSIKGLTRRDAIWIGLGQALALVPGVSRSGSTIATGLALGLKREEAARFSFLIGTPIALGAGAYKALGIVASQPSSQDLIQMLTGILVAGLLGLVVIRWLLGYLQSHSLKVFLIYRVCFALFILLILFLRG